jgi:ABC-type antimicrobial peptide transport system permease subunit
MGLEEIATHKTRTVLTMLSIAGGVATFIVLFSLIEGNSQKAHSWLIESGGLEKMTVKDRWISKEERLSGRANRSRGRTVADAEALRAKLLLANEISPETGEETTVKRGGKEADEINVAGVLHEILVMNRYEMARGRFLCDLDQRRSASVCVIGTAVVEKLFPGEDPLGKSVTVRGRPYQVVGVLKHYSRMYGSYNAFKWKNEVCFLPLSTVLHRQRGNDRLDWLNVRIQHTERMAWVLDQARNMLLWRHGVEDFKFDTSENWAENLRKQDVMYTVILAIVGAVCLLSGGVGIMNIMLAMVQERTREIGVRRALGARRDDIMGQFVLETVVLAVLGGLSGLVLGVFFSWALSFLPQQVSILRVAPCAIAFVAAVLVCLVFGLFPAWRASQLDPIEALRYE